MDEGRRASGSMPICSRSERRREEALASTRSFCVLDRTAEEPRTSSGFEGRRATILLEAISDASFGKIIGRHLDKNFITGQHSNTILAHPARCMRNDLMAVVKLYAKCRIREKLR